MAFPVLADKLVRQRSNERGQRGAAALCCVCKSESAIGKQSCNFKIRKRNAARRAKTKQTSANEQAEAFALSLSLQRGMRKGKREGVRERWKGGERTVSCERSRKTRERRKEMTRK